MKQGRRLSLLTIMVSVVVMSSLSPIVSQEEPKEKRWGLRLGVWYPTDGDVRELTNSWWIYFGLENHLSGTANVSLDYGHGSGTFLGIRNRVELYSLFYNIHRGEGRTGWLLDLGIVYMRTKSGAESTTKTDPGLTVGVSQKLGANDELQLRYQTGMRSGNTGLVLNLGFRF